jgi:chemotaxis protein methyltransferase CheR
MIYFDDTMKKQVLNMFADQLADDGYLFIGHSETIRSGEAPFQALPLPQAFCYRKLTSKTV